ncbi:MAG: hypothetical protein AAB605_01915 [Patescibacteria group bacterium]
MKKFIESVGYPALGILIALAAWFWVIQPLTERGVSGPRVDITETSRAQDDSSSDEEAVFNRVLEKKAKVVLGLVPSDGTYGGASVTAGGPPEAAKHCVKVNARKAGGGTYKRWRCEK